MDSKELKKKYDGLPLKTVAKKLQTLRDRHQKAKDKNAELWQRLSAAEAQHDVSWHWVKGLSVSGY